MSDEILPKKNEALRQVREALQTCPKCGKPFDEVDANSHLAVSTDPSSLRFYFQFVHGSKECIDFMLARDFGAWLEKARGH